MTLVSGSIQSLANGVSQQPPWVRLSSQLESQENFMSSLVSGLTRRPGTTHLASLTFPTTARPYIHVIDRDESNRFIVLVGNGDLRVFDINGTERTVSFPNGKSYLSSADPERSFAAVSVVDYTFIVNRNRQVLPQAFAPAPTRYGYVYVRQGAYSCNYKVFINSQQVASFTTSATDAATVQTQYIAEQLANQMATGLASYGWVVERKEATIRIRHNANNDFAITARDGGGDTYTRAFRDTVQNFTDLPSRMFDGAWVEVIGSASNQFDSYYVRFDEVAGAWRETVYPEDAFGMEPSTMPHQLVRNPDGTFTFQQVAWEKRSAGDVASSPDPSFVFRTISDVFFWKGRLGFISDDSVIMSAANDFFRFYPDTVTALLDGDPIDISAGFTRVAPVRFATPYQGGLLLWSDNTQFELVADGGVPTPSTVSIEQPSAFPTSVVARPVEAGKGVFFAFQRGGYAGVREYLTDRATDTKDALDTTIHVPSYIPGVITQLAVLRNENLVLALTDGDPRCVYAYKYHWEGEAKLQSSWSRWTFGETDQVWAVASLGRFVVLVLKRGNQLFLESLEANADTGEAGLTWPVALDRKVTLTGVYNAGLNRTAWLLPYAALGHQVVLGSLFGPRTGTVPDGLWADGNYLAAPGNWTAGPVVAGIRFRSSVTLSRITPEDRQNSGGRGRTAITDGRLQLQAVYPILAEAGTIKASVYGFDATRYQSAYPDVLASGMPPFEHYVRYGMFEGRSPLGNGTMPRTIQWQPRTLTAASSLALVTDGRWRVPVYARNDEVYITLHTDNQLPCSILSLDWEGIFMMRSQRI